MSYRIVACDDESHITRAVSMKLKKGNFEVDTASDGEAAWQLIQQRPPDLLITDCQMPRLDGVALCRRLRSYPETAELPVILLTGKGFELDIEQLKDELTITDVVVKPFSPRELLQTVQQILPEQAVTK